MRTKYRMSAAKPRCWCVALLAVCVCAPGVSGQGPIDQSNPTHNASLSSSSTSLSGNFGLAQESQPEVTQVSSSRVQQPATLPPELALVSLPPETQGDLLMIHQR